MREYPDRDLDGWEAVTCISGIPHELHTTSETESVKWINKTRICVTATTRALLVRKAPWFHLLKTRPISPRRLEAYYDRYWTPPNPVTAAGSSLDPSPTIHIT